MWQQKKYDKYNDNYPVNPLSDSYHEDSQEQ